ESLFVGGPVFRFQSCPSSIGYLVHSRPVTSQEGDIVLQHEKLIDLQSASGCAPESVLGLVQPAEISMVHGKVVVVDGEVWVDFNGRSGLGGCLLVSAGKLVGISGEKCVGYHVPRIGPGPCFTGL